MILNKLSLFECFMHKTYKSVSNLRSYPFRFGLRSIIHLLKLFYWCLYSLTNNTRYLLLNEKNEAWDARYEK